MAKFTLEEMRQLFVDLIYASDKRTCPEDFCEAECDVTENPVNKCRRCAGRILDEYEAQIRAEVIDEYTEMLKNEWTLDSILCATDKYKLIAIFKRITEQLKGAE